MPLFFIPVEQLTADVCDIRGSVCRIVGEDARHIALSLRMACGDGVTLADGRGMHYECVLTGITPELVEAEIISCSRAKTEPPYRLTLYQAMPKSDKLETIVQKAVELGATDIQPFVSSFCVKRPHEDKWEKQSARLSRIAWEAAKQCRRGAVPRIHPLLSFSSMLGAAKGAALSLFCYEGAGTVPLPDCLPDALPSSIAVVIGSEGGFSEGEAREAAEAGLCPVALGRRILRCETASAAVLSALAFRYDMR